MIDLRPIFLSTGLMLCAFAAAMLLPAAVDLADGNRDWLVFAASAAVTFFIGSLMTIATPAGPGVVITLKTGFLLTTTVWLVVTAFAALPFIGVGLSYTDAYFEAMSGLTTTGSTVLVRLDDLPRGILLWRCVLQLIGGIGIVVTAIMMLPFLRIGGMQLFMTESSDRSDKALPRAAEVVLAISGIYMLLVGLCALGYLWLGMSGFDAICHAFTTVSTGGFSTHDESFGFFRSPALYWLCTIFMVLGAFPFIVIYRAVALRQPRAIVDDAQIRGFLWILAASIAVMALYLVLYTGAPLGDALTKAAFNVTSVVTTTGYATEDYTRWGTFAVGLFFLLMFIGGCSGSTAGGIKIYRLQIVWLLTLGHLNQLATPHRISARLYNGRRMDADVAFSVVSFVYMYMATALVFTFLLAATGVDLVTALSSSVQAIASVGPGLGEVVGPAGNFSALPATAKWILSLEMLLGRLEIFTILVLFRPEFWT